MPSLGKSSHFWFFPHLWNFFFLLLLENCLALSASSAFSESWPRLAAGASCGIHSPVALKSHVPLGSLLGSGNPGQWNIWLRDEQVTLAPASPTSPVLPFSYGVARTDPEE